MNIKVEIDIKGLDQLTESLALLGSALAYKNNMVETAEAAVDLIDEVKKEEPKEEDKKEVPKKEYPKPKPEANKEAAKKEPAKEEPAKEEVKSKFTREDVRSAFVSKNSPDTRDKLKAILDKFEAPNISDLEEKHFEDAIKELEAI